ncbi:cytidine deaminase [Olsenella sp. Marseille-P4559]|uniref:cytidine deaminase n=1 Tax=Olsenella sp. Marseille-P4559 TaxID=2364795 RepID=UPI001031A9E3
MGVSDTKLARLALEARERAYVPYSHFSVGAALLCADGSIYQGFNIENAAYTPSNCAERTAFFRAVFKGQRNFAAIAIAGGPEGEDATEWCAPCGVCRQVMREFCDPSTFRIVLARSDGGLRTFLLRELLPESFGPEDLGREGAAYATEERG